MSLLTGNRLTDNALTADDGNALIAKALSEIKSQTGWQPVDDSVLFSGVYYDSSKVGSFITRVIHTTGEAAVLKIQLRPLPFDEGFIIRHIEKENRSKRIRLPRIIADEAWNETRSYGYVLFEDLSRLPHLWPTRPDAAALMRHQDFLTEFMEHVLPIAPYLPVPEISPREKYKEAFEHFSRIARASSHQHIAQEEVDKMRTQYFRAIDQTTFTPFHFTHGHLSGHEIVEDRATDSFILFANLLWSFRPTYYEIIFPLWVDLMAIRDVNVTSKDLLEQIDRWSDIWNNIQGTDPRKDQAFWFSILERSMLTVMLDLGASEWKTGEEQEKQALLHAWKDLFHAILSRHFDS